MEGRVKYENYQGGKGSGLKNRRKHKRNLVRKEIARLKREKIREAKKQKFKSEE